MLNNLLTSNYPGASQKAQTVKNKQTNKQKAACNVGDPGSICTDVRVGLWGCQIV